MKKILLHIGAGKTGSSSIQSSLGQNRDYLRKLGFIVPTSDLQPDTTTYGQQVWYFANYRNMSIDAAKSKLKQDIDNVFTNVDAAMHTLIMSAENLSDDYGWQKLFEDIKSEYEISILFYVRRQDSYLLSAWQQWYVKNNGDFWAWLTRVVGKLANWQDIIEQWLTVIEKDNVIIRKFERSSLVQGNVVADFYEVLGIDISSLSKESLEIQTNKSFNHGVLDFIENNKKLFTNSHDNEFYHFIDATTLNSHKNSKHSIITFEQRKSILNNYSESNKWIKDNFMHELQGDYLFKMPKKEDYIYLNKNDIQEQKWNIVIESLFTIYKSLK